MGHTLLHPKTLALKQPQMRRLPRILLALALVLHLALASLVAAAPVLAAPAAQAGELTTYTHPQGLFTLDVPTAFSVEMDLPTPEDDQLSRGDIGFASFGFLDPTDNDSVVFVFLLDTGEPFVDYFDWEAIVDDMLRFLITPRPSYLEFESDEETLHLRMVVRSDRDAIYTVAAHGEGSLLAMAVAATSASEWDGLSATLEASVESFTWDPDAVAAYLGAAATPADEPDDLDENGAAVRGWVSYEDPDGFFSFLMPAAFIEDFRMVGAEVADMLPDSDAGVVSVFIDPNDAENVIAFFFWPVRAELDLQDADAWYLLVDEVTADLFLDDAETVEILIDEPDTNLLRRFMEIDDISFYFELQGAGDLVALIIAGGPDWAAWEDDMTTGVESFMWDPAAIRAALDMDALQPDIDEPDVDEPDVDEPDVDEPDADEPDVDEPDTDQPDTPRLDAPIVPGFLDWYQRLEDDEDIFTFYAPARLQSSAFAEWEDAVFSVYHNSWAADANYEELYYTSYLAVVGPANQIMAAHAELTGDDLPAPSLAAPSLEEWHASLDLYAANVQLPPDSLFVRYDLPGDEYGVVFYAEGTDEVEDESYRIWTYMTQKEGLGFILVLLGPLEEPNVIVHADPEQIFPLPIDLALESVSWDLEAARSAILERLADSYTPQELAALAARPFDDPEGGFTLAVPPQFTAHVRTLERDAIAVGFRTPETRNGLLLRLTDIGETLTADEWLEVLETVAAEFWPLVNAAPDDPAPEILAESVSTTDFNYAAYEIVGTAQHALFEFVEIDGLFAFAAGLTELDDWATLEPEMRHMMASIELDSDVILENLAELAGAPAALLNAEVLEAPVRTPMLATFVDAPSLVAPEDITPFALSAVFDRTPEPENLALIINGPCATPAAGDWLGTDCATVGQISGLTQEEIGSSQSLLLALDSEGAATAQFRFAPATPWRPGPHIAYLYYGDTLVGEFAFTVRSETADDPDLSVVGGIGGVSLQVADQPNPNDEAALYAFAPDDIVRYAANLATPAGAHQVRLFVYHEGRLLPELIRTWHLRAGVPAAGRDWAAGIDLQPEGGWQPGGYSLHLWVNDSPWDVRDFVIVEPAPPLDALADPDAFLAALPTSDAVISGEALADGDTGLVYQFGAAAEVVPSPHLMLFDAWDAWLRDQGYRRARVGLDPAVDAMLPQGGKVRRYVNGESQILTRLEDHSDGLGFAWQASIQLLQPGDGDYADGLLTGPLTPDSAANLAPQALLEPVDAPEYIDIAFVNDGRALATLNLDNELVVYDTATWREVYRYAPGVFGWNLTTDAAGSRLAVAYQELGQDLNAFRVVVWDTATWQVATVLDGHAGAVTAMAFNDAGDWLITAGLDTTLRTWSLSGELPTTLINDGMEGGDFAVTALDVQMEDNRLALVYSDGLGEMWRIMLAEGASTASPLYTFEVGGRDAHVLHMFPPAASRDPALDAAFAGPPMLIVGGNEVQVWTYYDQVAEQAYALSDPTLGRLVAAGLSPDAQTLIMAGDNTFVVDTLAGEILAELDYAPVQKVDISATGLIALLDGAGNIYVIAPVE